MSVTGKSIYLVLVKCTGGLSLPKNSVVRLIDHPDMTITVYHGLRATAKHNNKHVIGACLFRWMGTSSLFCHFFKGRQFF